MEEIKSWREEKRSAYLYRVMAEKEKGSPPGALFSQLALEAESQAKIWAEKIRKAQSPLPEFAPDLRARVVAFLIRKLGVRRLRMALAAMKIRGLSAYSASPPGHPTPTNLEEVGLRHRGAGAGGNLRAAVFGVNDGLVSNASLILGVAGASHNPKVILLSGIAGLLAGAFSMAAGEFISVTSQREMFEHQIDLEKKELAEYPDQEAAELALIYEAKGLARPEADDLAKKLIANPRRALDTLAREELGLNIEELGSPWGAALASFFAFSTGALIPLFPFFFTVGQRGLLTSAAVTASSLFAVGAVLSLFTGRRAVYSGFRMLLIGGGAGAATYLIGRFLGVTLS